VARMTTGNALAALPRLEVLLGLSESGPSRA